MDDDVDERLAWLMNKIQPFCTCEMIIAEIYNEND